MMTRFVDYYQLLNLHTTASSEEIQAALSTAEARLRDNQFPSPQEAREFEGMLSRARTVLGDENNRMMYDILGKDITAEDAVNVSAPAAPIFEPSAQDVFPDEGVLKQSKTPSKPDSEKAFEHLCEELDRKADRLRQMDEENKGASRRRFSMRRALIVWFGFLFITLAGYYVFSTQFKVISPFN